MSDWLWAVIILSAVIIGCAAMTWYRPWWYQTRGETIHGRYVTPEGVIAYYRLNGDNLVIDRMAHLDKATLQPVIHFGDRFTLLWTDGGVIDEMMFVSLTTSEGITEGTVRNTASLEDPDD